MKPRTHRLVLNALATGGILAFMILSGSSVLAGEASSERAQSIQKSLETLVAGGLGILSIGILACLLVLVQLAFPGITACAAEGLQKSLLRSFLLGILTALGVFIIVLISSTIAQPLGVLALILFGSLSTLLGCAAMSEDLGRRIFSTSESQWSRPGQLFTGWLVFIGSSLVPVLGWFLIFPFFYLAGVGAVVRQLLRRRDRKPESTTDQEPSMPPEEQS